MRTGDGEAVSGPLTFISLPGAAENTLPWLRGGIPTACGDTDKDLVNATHHPLVVTMYILTAFCYEYACVLCK